MTAAQKKSMAAMRRRGLTLREIAARFSVSVPAASVALRSLGVKRGPLVHSTDFWKDSKRSRDLLICELRKSGMSLRKIAAMFGLTGQRVHSILGTDSVAVMTINGKRRPPRL